MAARARAILPLQLGGCGGCERRLSKGLGQLPGVAAVHDDLLNHTVRVRYDPRRLTLPELEAAVERLGFRLAHKTYPPWWQRWWAPGTRD